MKYSLYIIGAFIFVMYSCKPSTDTRTTTPQSGASRSLDEWALARSYPNSTISTYKLTTAFEQAQNHAQIRNNNAKWEALGPMNIAGRTLALAFHPTDTNTIFLGSASGGLWKTTTAGLGVKAWNNVSVGTPILAVSSIAISKQSPDVMYIGTGEMYNSEESKPGMINRLTRGTYGFGIFKSSDGGTTWEKSLDWAYENLRGVQKISINPKNDQTLYAATSIGLMKTVNGGKDWLLLHEMPMAVDVEINPIDTNIIYVSYGSLFEEKAGIYRSKDGGKTFQLLRIGLPEHYTGKALLSLDPSSDNVVYASIADAFQSIGLYRSSNHGDSWLQLNNVDIAAFQGWYSHDVAVNPKQPDDIIQVGIDAWLSENSGFTMTQQTSWNNARFGKNPIGEPDGPPDYVHPDIHQVLFHPLMKNTVFLATDGGVFASLDGGRTYESRNGGLQTAQFYPNFSNSTTSSKFAIGGMQDNSTAIYTGEPAWTKVLVGDGMSAAIDPTNDNIVYGSSQFLNIFRSTNRGQTFEDIAPGAIEPIFSAPFEVALSNPRILYAGGRLLFKSTDRGNTWFTPNPDFVDEGNSLLTIAVDPNNFNRIMVSTAPNFTGIANVFKSENGGLNWTKLQGLPDRIATDMAFHPENEDIAFITFSGFNSFHVYQTLDGGENWFPIDNNLPDIPHNTIIIDPNQSDNIYLGNDLGIYVSEDGGGNWSPFMQGLPEAILAIHLSISPSNQKLRIATHGNGVYETDLIGKVVSNISTPTQQVNILKLEQNYPNPTQQFTNLSFTLFERSDVTLKLFDSTGKVIKTVFQQKNLKGKQDIQLDLSSLPTGNYVYQLSGTTLTGNYFKQHKILQKL